MIYICWCICVNLPSRVVINNMFELHNRQEITHSLNINQTICRKKSLNDNLIGCWRGTLKGNFKLHVFLIIQELRKILFEKKFKNSFIFPNIFLNREIAGFQKVFTLYFMLEISSQNISNKSFFTIIQNSIALSPKPSQILFSTFNWKL